MENNSFKYKMKIDNKTIDTLLEKKQKRALFIYVLLLKRATGGKVAQTSISEMVYELRLEGSTKTNNSVRKSFQTLVEEGLISIYLDKGLEKKVNISDKKLVKNGAYLQVSIPENLSEERFTLVEVAYIERLIQQNSNESVEDMVVGLTLMCRFIERKEEVLQVTWYSRDNIIKRLSIGSDRYNNLIEEMKRLEVLYFEKAVIKFEKGKREHFIYAMFDKAEHVKQAVATAETNGVLDIRVKLNLTKTDDTEAVYPDVDEETGELIWCPITFELETLAHNIGFEMNKSSAKCLNSFAGKYSYKKLIGTINSIAGIRIGGLYENLINVDNVTGYVIGRLNEEMKEGLKLAS